MDLEFKWSSWQVFLIGMTNTLLEFFIPLRTRHNLFDSLLESKKTVFLGLKVAAGKEPEDPERSAEIIRALYEWQILFKFSFIWIPQPTEF